MACYDETELEVVWQKVDEGDYLEAIKSYTCIIEQREPDARVFALRGYAKYRAGRFHEAEVDLSTALEMIPDATNTMFIRAKCKQELGNFEGLLLITMQ